MQYRGYRLNPHTACLDVINRPGPPTTKSATFSGFTAAEVKTANITGVGSNNPEASEIKLFVSSDPGADENILFKLSFYKKDTMLEKDRIATAFAFNLTYTETNGGASASDTSDVLDSVAGLVEDDVVRYLGGTAESRVVKSINAGTKTITFDALDNDHADDSGVVRVAVIHQQLKLQDLDGSNEIHAKLEALSAPTGSMDVTMEVDIK
jgi:hypothetical protein